MSVEPRLGLKYIASRKSTFSFGYGLHSQSQTPGVYFYRAKQANGSYVQGNKDLGFTRSQHIVLGYDYLPAKDWRIKTEVYVQHLWDVPVNVAPTSYSLLNEGATFLPFEQGNLINKGKGINYGMEFTLEKFFSKGYYGLLTGTIYESKYKGSDGVERNTAFNGKYVANVLVGKEVKLGKRKQNTLFVDAKFTTAGGRFYTPVDLIASQAIGTQVNKGDAFAYTERNADYFRIDVKIGYTYNSAKRKIAQSFFFDVQNVTNHKNVFAQRYNTVSNTVNTAYQIGLFPNFTYKVQF
jgi:hypothetical protein